MNTIRTLSIDAVQAADSEEYARVVAFLASDDATYIEGETINVNAGVVSR